MTDSMINDLTDSTDEINHFADMEGVTASAPDGKYRAVVADSKVITGKSGKNANKKQWVINYKVIEGPQKGEHFSEFFLLEGASQEQKKWRARRLESLEVPESRWTSFRPSEIKDERVLITVKTNGQYQNVTSVSLDKQVGESLADQLSSASGVAPTQSPGPASADLL